MMSTPSAIRSKCLKCGREGTQVIYYKPSKTNPQRAYLRMNHGKDDKCFIGRIHSLDEAMTQLSQNRTTIKKPSLQEYKSAIHDIILFAKSQLDKKYGHEAQLHIIN